MYIIRQCGKRERGESETYTDHPQKSVITKAKNKEIKFPFSNSLSEPKKEEKGKREQKMSSTEQELLDINPLELKFPCKIIEFSLFLC